MKVSKKVQTRQNMRNDHTRSERKIYYEKKVELLIAMIGKNSAQ